MKLERLTVRGFMTSFAGKEVSIDFAALPAGLIAFVGDNGAGKSTLMEAGPAGLYREFMSREGDLKTYAQDRDSFIEARWSIAGAAYVVRLTIDGIKGGAAAAIRREDATKPLNDGKVSTFDPVVRSLFPPIEVFKASAFAAQNKSGSFITLGKKERRDLFASFLGADRLIRMSETATKAAAIVDQARVRVLAELELLRKDARAELLDELTRQTSAIGADRELAIRSRDQLTGDIAKLEQRLALLQDQVAAHASAVERMETAARALEEKHAALQAHEAECFGHTLNDGRLRSALTEAHQQRADALERQAKAAAAAAVDELTTIVEARDKTLADIATKLAGNQQIQDMAEDIGAAVATIAELTPEVEQLRTAVDRLRQDERRLAGEQAENERVISSFTKPQADLDRAVADAALLASVPCGGQGEFAVCQLLTNAKAAEARIADLERQVGGMRRALTVRERLAPEITRAAETIDAKQARIADLEKRLKAAQPTAAYADKLAASVARVEELHGQQRTVTADAGTRFEAAKARAAADASDRAQARAALDAQFEQDKTSQIDRIAARMTAESEKQVGLAQALAAAATASDRAVQVLKDLEAGNTQAHALQADLATAREQRDAAVVTAATCAADLQELDRRRVEIVAKTKRAEVMQGQLEQLDTELVEWQLLAKALGREGLPDLEIDQAGPGISATTNQLLADCFGSRFSVELVTQVARADGKGLKEEFTVLVTDNEGGDVRDIRDLSGGEQVIVAEALMNAIAIYVNERSQTPMRTCFRDETTGALNKENTQRYIQMLRAVQRIGGFEQVLFISHDPDAYNLADAQLHVACGDVTPLLPPYREAA